MTRGGNRSGARRAQPTPLPADPDAAFRQRAARDRARLSRLAERVRHQGARPRMAKSLAEIEELAHGLAGAGGVFGYPSLSAAAARLERLTERWRQARLPALSPRRKSLLAGAIRSLIGELMLIDGDDATSPGERDSAWR